MTYNPRGNETMVRAQVEHRAFGGCLRIGGLGISSTEQPYICIQRSISRVETQMFPVCLALLWRKGREKRGGDVHGRVDDIFPLDRVILIEEVQVICWFGLEHGPSYSVGRRCILL